MAKLVSNMASTLSGTTLVPGDKSISHRALMLGAVAVGETRIQGLLEGEDVLATAAAMRAMGVDVKKMDNQWIVNGVGLGGLTQPDGPLDMGNSGTAARLLMGLIAGHEISVTLIGDKSLSSRPMKRVMEPLEQMGAVFESENHNAQLPLTIRGRAQPIPISYDLPVASAQVKSAIILAGLSASGITTVVEPHPTRDHTEKMLTALGAEIKICNRADGAREISLNGQPELSAIEITVPGDISSAAFPMVAALVVAGSQITLKNIGLNPLRTGIIDSLKEMGANIKIINHHVHAGEEVGDIVVRQSPLKGIVVPSSRAPSMIDEYPVLAVGAAFATGTTRFEGVGELRVKESDRLAAVEAGLKAAGVVVRSGSDWMEIDGCGDGFVPGQGLVETHLDHRIAMAFLVLGMGAKNPVSIDDGAPIETSFPGFVELMNGLGANIKAL
ncbi:MAG: 3-phosphoshikimate 1-carboxyvinyltransferase [Rhodospirillaceae bacterium]|nr:3-phosphoshikimate 1-carboxyvinyltransferase [Rhodospirillaceae bacterium]